MSSMLRRTRRASLARCARVASFCRSLVCCVPARTRRDLGINHDPPQCGPFARTIELRSKAGRAASGRSLISWPARCLSRSPLWPSVVRPIYKEALRRSSRCFMFHSLMSHSLAWTPNLSICPQLAQSTAFSSPGSGNQASIFSPADGSFDDRRGRRTVLFCDSGQVVGQRTERHGSPALIDVAGITKVTGNPLPVPPGRLGTELLRLAFRQQHTISQVSDLGFVASPWSAATVSRSGALPLEGRIAVGVLCQQPGCVGPVVADDQSPWPASLGDHLFQPGKILGIDLAKQPRDRFRPARGLVPFSIRRRSSARRSGFMPSG